MFSEYFLVAGFSGVRLDFPGKKKQKIQALVKFYVFLTQQFGCDPKLKDGHKQNKQYLKHICIHPGR